MVIFDYAEPGNKWIAAQGNTITSSISVMLVNQYGVLNSVNVVVI